MCRTDAFCRRSEDAPVVATDAVESIVSRQTEQIGADLTAPNAKPFADSKGTGRLLGAHIPAGTAVVGVEQHARAGAIAARGVADALVLAVPVHARTHLVGARLVAGIAAATAVVVIVTEVGAVAAATRRPTGATGVVAATAADAAGVAAARLAGREALRLLLLWTFAAKGFAGIHRRPGPRGSQADWSQHGAGEHCPQPLQRFAARHGLGQ